MVKLALDPWETKTLDADIHILLVERPCAVSTTEHWHRTGPQRPDRPGRTA